MYAFVCVFQKLYHLQSRHRRPRVWTFNRVTEWWGVIIPSFTHTQWEQNFRTSEETYIYLCNKCHGEAYDDEWDAAAAEPGVAAGQGAEEEGSDIREGLMR